MKITLKDEMLLERWRRQQPEVLAEIIAEYSKPFYGFLVSLCGGTQKTADDFFARAFAEVLNSTIKTGDRSSLFLELLKYTVKTIKPSNVLPVAPLGSVFLPQLSTDEEIQMRILLSLRILASMNLEERIIILLRDLVELDIAEMAYVMGMQEEYLKSRLNASRIHFREKMIESLRSKDFYDLRNY